MLPLRFYIRTAEIGCSELVDDRSRDVARHNVLSRLSVLNDLRRNQIACGDGHTITQVEPEGMVTVTPLFTLTGPADNPLLPVGIV